MDNWRVGKKKSICQKLSYSHLNIRCTQANRRTTGPEPEPGKCLLSCLRSVHHQPARLPINIFFKQYSIKSPGKNRRLGLPCWSFLCAEQSAPCGRVGLVWVAPFWLCWSATCSCSCCNFCSCCSCCCCCTYCCCILRINFSNALNSRRGLDGARVFK